MLDIQTCEREISSPLEVKPIYDAGTRLRFSNNQMIFSEGDEAKAFYKVIAGRVRLYKMQMNGRRQIIDFMIPGDIFGVEFEGKYSVTAEAIGRTSLDCSPRRRLERLCGEDGNIRDQVMSLLYRNLISTQIHMLMLGRETANERLVAFLVSLAKRFKINQGDVLELGMPRQDIADYVGLALETVCRELARLQREGLIEILDRRRIAIIDFVALQDYVEGRDAL